MDFFTNLLFYHFYQTIIKIPKIYKEESLIKIPPVTIIKLKTVVALGSPSEFRKAHITYYRYILAKNYFTVKQKIIF